jgi:hypothetical protein
MGISISKQRVLICEGDADKAFFTHLLRERGLPEFDVFHPYEMDGVASGNSAFGDFLRGLSVLLPSAAVSGVLLISDNDLDPAASFDAVRQQIRIAGGFGVPRAPLEVARATGYPPLAVMMLPWTGAPGGLETLCLDAVYASRPELRECLDGYCDCAGTNTWDLSRLSKMRMQCALAAMCHSKPATSIRYAWSRAETMVPLNQGCFDQIANTLATFDELVA